MTAAAVIARVFAGQRMTSPIISGCIRILLENDNLPVWDTARKTTDYYYWYCGTLAIYLTDGPRPGKKDGGRLWKRWNHTMLTALIEGQIGKEGGCARGSWPANTPQGMGKWACEGGRAYTTAINVLTLEACIRYQIPETDEH